MSSVIHIAEVATLLTVAYALGWLIGYVARRLVSRPTAVLPAIPAERLAAVTGAAIPDALVKAPIIVPVAGDVQGAAPAPAETAPAVASAEPVAPAFDAQAAAAAPEPSTPPLSSIVIPSVAAPPPLFPTLPEPAPAAAPEPVVVAVAPEPPPILTEPRPDAEQAPAISEAPAPQPAPVFMAMPAARPGEAWSGEVRGRAAQAFRREVEAVAPEPAAEAIAEPAPLEITVAPPPVEESSIVLAAPPEAPAPPREYDEDEAMRAIEGGWSRVKARAMPDAPELHDVGAAVAAAQTAVEQVLAQAGIDPAQPSHTGKPKGLVRPRPDGQDDLKRINGLGALDESTLNNLGFFHFHQIASWSEAEVLWMESHVFARGRIGREEWQAQAQALAATVDG